MSKAIVPVEHVQNIIFLLRGQRVMLDSDLVALYEVKTAVLNRQVQRNFERFPADFMFQLTAAETTNLKCQTGTSSSGHGGRKQPESGRIGHFQAITTGAATKLFSVSICIPGRYTQFQPAGLGAFYLN